MYIHIMKGDFNMNKNWNTPLIKIHYEYNGKKDYFYTKLEYYNLTGSIKDRVAYYMITKAKERGDLKEGMPLIEATSGNIGISVAALGAYYGHPTYIFMPDWVSQERLQILKMFNANVTLYSKEEGGFLRCIEEAKKLANDMNGYFTNQFANPDNVLAHYETTGEELIKGLDEEIGGFVSGIGTGGTLMGVSKRLKEVYPDMITVALEPDKAPMLTQNKVIEQHAIEGIGDDFIPDIVDKDKIDDVILVDDNDAINMARITARNLGLGIGISSGANIIASVILGDKIGKRVATVFADDNKKYLSTNLSNPIDTDEAFISNKIKLLGYEEC